MYLAEDTKVVNILPPKDISAGAHSTAYVSLKNYNHVDFVITMGATGAIGSSIAVTLKQAINVSGSSNSSLAIGHYYKNLAALASSSVANDTFTKTSVASSGASFKLVPSTNNGVYIIPVDAQDLSVNSSMAAVGIGVQTTGAATLCGVTAILSGSRERSDNPPSALS